MNSSKISVRYAKALFLASKEKNELDIVFNDIKFIQVTFKEIPQIKNIMESPVKKDSDKINIINSCFSGKLNSLSLSFLKLIIKNKREKYILSIARNFIDSYKENKGIKTANLTTAYSIDENTRQYIINKIEKSLNKIVELHETVNPEIIGGFILKIEDQQIDSSVTSKLLQIQRKLVDN